MVTWNNWYHRYLLHIVGDQHNACPWLNRCSDFVQCLKCWQFCSRHLVECVHHQAEHLVGVRQRVVEPICCWEGKTRHIWNFRIFPFLNFFSLTGFHGHLLIGVLHSCKKCANVPVTQECEECHVICCWCRRFVVVVAHCQQHTRTLIAILNM